LWGGAFWTSGYFITTVGCVGCEKAVFEYVRTQGRDKGLSPNDVDLPTGK